MPSGHFRTGVKVCKLTDEGNNNDALARTTSSANYESTGLRQQTQGAIVALKTANVTPTYL